MSKLWCILCGLRVAVPCNHDHGRELVWRECRTGSVARGKEIMKQKQEKRTA